MHGQTTAPALFIQRYFHSRHTMATVCQWLYLGNPLQQHQARESIHKHIPLDRYRRRLPCVAEEGTNPCLQKKPDTDEQESLAESVSEKEPHDTANVANVNLPKTVMIATGEATVKQMSCR